MTTNGGVKCWGSNSTGELGDGTTNDKNIPVTVNSLNNDITGITAGSFYTCAITTGGGVKCWGANSAGQLGDGTNRDKNVPVDVKGLNSGVTAIAAGGSHTCALTLSGGVKCWGQNHDGQLGDGTTDFRSDLVDVNGLGNGVVAITAGGSHTCALTAGGGVKCWGYNAFGQLGDGTTTRKNIPVDVGGLSSGVTAIAAGSGHTCALITTGGVKCWGYNDDGQLGDGTTSPQSFPVNVAGLSSGVTAVAVGEYHTCALTITGGVKCWGENQSGELGDGTIDSRNVPVDVNGLSSEVIAIAAGGNPFYDNYTCAVITSGGVKCWGTNHFGQLGIGLTSGNKKTPVAVNNLSTGVTAITAGTHTCALIMGGDVKCWGDNGSGQLGDGTISKKNVPTDVSSLTSGIMKIAAGYAHTCALTRDSGVKCWGKNRDGALGDNTTIDQNTPINVYGLYNGIATIATGDDHTCVTTTTGGVKCWGNNYFGQLGDSTSVFTRSIPVDVSGSISGVTTIAAGGNHTCALLASGGVKCWGYNHSGQLGNGNNTSTNIAVDVSGLSGGITAIVGGSSHTCVLTSSGGVKCWGANYSGQLGDGSTDDKNIPVEVSGLNSDVIAITASGSHTCALLTSGIVRCWGANHSGQLGDGSLDDKNTPTNVTDLGDEITAIAAGNSHTCALTTAGGVKCWGDNEYGQLGDGSAWRTTPVDVVEAELATPTPTATSIATNTPTPTATSMTTPVATNTLTPTAEPTIVTARVEGKVLDQETQTGIADVLLTLSSANRHTTTASALMGDATVYTATTGFDGAFVFPAVRIGTYTLSGAKAGVVIQSPAPLVISGSGTVPIAPLQATKASAMLYLPLVTKR